MKQQYILTIEAKKLSGDMSKDIAREFNGECFLDLEDVKIKVEKMNLTNNCKEVKTR
jgi:hypothetical protein